VLRTCFLPWFFCFALFSQKVGKNARITMQGCKKARYARKKKILSSKLFYLFLFLIQRNGEKKRDYEKGD
jgi:hypothetical protein